MRLITVLHLWSAVLCGEVALALGYVSSIDPSFNNEWLAATNIIGFAWNGYYFLDLYLD